MVSSLTPNLSCDEPAPGWLKVKRLFLWSADRHRHAWHTQLDRNRIDIGSGKRLLVRGGRLDPKYQITVPKDLNAGG